jgi:S-adenosylmethionine-diacylglycerol 3-amino-3-carboxypropyl transferase
MTRFFSRLSYSLGNEDGCTEKHALNIQPQDKVLCITASGDRPLNLLTSPCEKIVCIDANPVQNFLLELKKAAMQTLTTEAYLAFLGANTYQHRLKTFAIVAEALSVEARQFWLQQTKMIERGVLYQGTVERFVKKGATFLNLIRGSAIRDLFAMNDLEEQRSFVKTKWHHPLWQKLFELILNPGIAKVCINDPGLYEHVKDGIKPGRYIYQRMNQSLERYLAKENLLLSLILRGFVSPEAYSPYLKAEGIDKIKPHLDSLSIKTGNVVNYLNACMEPTFDCFSMSDVESYMNKEGFNNLLKGMYKAAKPGARFAMRQFLSGHEIPSEWQSRFVRDHTLEAELENQERCFVYRFMAGIIHK